jgi:DNA-binding PadR family transcriptional regulator
MKGDNLGEFEELVLLAVRARGEDATGATIQEELERRAGRAVALGAIYAALDRGERKGLVTSWLGEPQRRPGGRRRRHYAVTKQGERALSESRRVRESLWHAGEATT